MSSKVNTTVVAIISLVVAVALFSALLVPAIASASYTISTEEQNTTEKYMVANENTEGPITIVHKESGVWTINGEDFTIPSTYFTVGFSDHAVLRFENSTLAILTDEGERINATSLTYFGGIATITLSNNNTRTMEWSQIYYPSVNGTWGCFEHLPNVNEPVHIDNDVTAYFIGNITWNTTTHTEFYGVWEFSNGEITRTIVPAHYATQYNGAFNVDPDAEVTLSYTEDESTISKTYVQGAVVAGGTTYPSQSYILAPLTYHIHTDADSATLSLLNLIPLLVLAGLVIGVVGSFIRNRD